MDKWSVVLRDHIMMFLPQKQKIVNMWNDGYVVYFSYGKYLPIYDHRLLLLLNIEYVLLNMYTCQLYLNKAKGKKQVRDFN